MRSDTDDRLGLEGGNRWAGCMSPYHEVRENAASTRIALLTSAFRISSKGSSSQSPYLLWQLPIHADSRLLEKSTDERFRCDQVPRSTLRTQEQQRPESLDEMLSPRAFCAAKLNAGSFVLRQSNHHICVDSGCHCPSSRVAI